jgi:hypothetical protein
MYNQSSKNNILNNNTRLPVLKMKLQNNKISSNLIKLRQTSVITHPLICRCNNSYLLPLPCLYKKILIANIRIRSIIKKEHLHEFQVILILNSKICNKVKKLKSHMIPSSNSNSLRQFSKKTVRVW